MIEEIKTYEERKKELIEKGKENGYITYEQLATSLKGGMVLMRSTIFSSC